MVRSPPVISVAPGTTVQWRAEVNGLASPALLAQQTENPALHPLSALNPISNTLGWDGGMLGPGQTYQRRMDTPGLYTYTDGTGHQGEVCVTPCSPLAVTLASFDATAQTNHIAVSWETVSEIGNTGFNLYRSTNGDWGSAVLLTYVPSQAPGSAQGASYSYDDFGVSAGQTAWYWLEAVDFNGATSVHGPVSATLQVSDGRDVDGVRVDASERLAGYATGYAVAGAGGLVGAAYTIKGENGSLTFQKDWTFLGRKVQSFR